MDKIDKLWSLMESVEDPEIPVINIVELGIVRSISEDEISITPTYSGCPAMNMIEAQIRVALDSAGFEEVGIKIVNAPAWTTDWIPDKAKEKLKQYGIAPPTVNSQFARALGMLERQPVKCPRCDSDNTELVSEFGSTACKALYKCRECKEPFDYFKCH